MVEKEYIDYKPELKNRIMELVNKEDFKKDLEKEIDYLLNSGYLNVEKEHTENYQMAKMVLYCALRGYTRHFRPLDTGFTKQYKSLIKHYGE